MTDKETGEPGQENTPDPAGPDAAGTDSTDGSADGAAPSDAGSCNCDDDGVCRVPGSEDGAGEDASFTVEDILNAKQDADPKDPGQQDLLTDLKRVQAEYANYRRRTEEQRTLEIERAKGAAAKGLIPVLDDLDRAAKHGDLTEGTPFAAIAEKVRAVAERMGVQPYGAAGEVFDPQQHEAIFQQPTPGATESTVLEVVEVGYRLGSIELRPAKVVVAVPAE